LVRRSHNSYDIDYDEDAQDLMEPTWLRPRRQPSLVRLVRKRSPTRVRLVKRGSAFAPRLV
jgi:hypothetical protein